MYLNHGGQELLNDRLWRQVSRSSIVLVRRAPIILPRPVICHTQHKARSSRAGDLRNEVAEGLWRRAE